MLPDAIFNWHLFCYNQFFAVYICTLYVSYAEMFQDLPALLLRILCLLGPGFRTQSMYSEGHCSLNVAKVNVVRYERLAGNDASL